MAEPFLGQILLFAGNFPPRQWAFCDGQLLPISEHSALFSILGTTYGGDGESTFALPDMRGRTAIHAGHGPGLSDRSLGAQGGRETVVLTADQMPRHTHASNGISDAATSGAPAGAHFAHAEEVTYGPAVAGRLAPTAAALDSAGLSQPHENRQPWLGVNYIIALQGVFPSRS